MSTLTAYTTREWSHPMSCRHLMSKNTETPSEQYSRQSSKHSFNHNANIFANDPIRTIGLEQPNTFQPQTVPGRKGVPNG